MYCHPDNISKLDSGALSRMSPAAQEAKMKALEEFNPLRDFCSFLRSLLSKKAN
jgi:hypothetical protein